MLNCLRMDRKDHLVQGRGIIVDVGLQGDDHDDHAWKPRSCYRVLSRIRVLSCASVKVEHTEQNHDTKQLSHLNFEGTILFRVSLGYVRSWESFWGRRGYVVGSICLLVLLRWYNCRKHSTGKRWVVSWQVCFFFFEKSFSSLGLLCFCTQIKIVN